MISYESNKGPRESTILGQNLFSVFSNYSYTCHVSMMGDAQITPLMFFQLNNIPMWKGAYIITNVHHDISVAGMETTFTGTRIARPSLPIKDDTLDVPAGDATKQTPQSQDEVYTQNPKDVVNLNISDKPLDKIDVNNVFAAYFILSRNSIMNGADSDVLTLVNGTLRVEIVYKKGYHISGETIGIAKTIEGTHVNDAKERDKIENTNVFELEPYFSLPKGRYEKVAVENPRVGKEYRDQNDGFYEFTNGQHIMVTDSRLEERKSEIVTGETDFKEFKAGNLNGMCLGGASPIMLYAESGDKEEGRAIYQEVFNFVKRMNEAMNPLTMYVTEPDNLLRIKIEQ